MGGGEGGRSAGKEVRSGAQEGNIVFVVIHYN